MKSTWLNDIENEWLGCRDLVILLCDNGITVKTVIQ